MSLDRSTEGRPPSSGSNSSDRSANAPEADTSVLALEYREHVDLEVCKSHNEQRVTDPRQVPPGGGIQPFYHSNPPEAVATTSPSNAGSLLADDVSRPHRLRRIIVALGIVIALLLAATLGLALGLAFRPEYKHVILQNHRV